MPGHPVGCRSRPTGQRGADHQLGLRLWSHEIAGECRDLSAARAGVDAVAGFFVSAPAANMRLTRNKNGGRPFDSGLPHFYHRGVKTPENYHEFVRTIAIPPDCDILCVCRLFHAFLPRLEGASGRRGRRFKSCHPDCHFLTTPPFHRGQWSLLRCYPGSETAHPLIRARRPVGPAYLLIGAGAAPIVNSPPLS
jgi:hypothetical protein